MASPAVGAAAGDVLRKLRVPCVQQRIRIEQFFRDFDKLRSGIVTRDQFCRALAISGLHRFLNDADYEILFSEYASQKDPSKIAYSLFCDAVDAVFTKKKLEKAPTQTDADEDKQVNVLASRNPENQLSEQEWETLNHLTSRFVAEAKSRGLVLKEFFRDFDKHRSGKVTAAQFQRAFPFRLDPAEIDVMLKRYKSNEQFAAGDIQYLKWVGEIDKIVATSQVVAKPAAAAASPSRARKEHDCDGLVSELRRQVRQNRLRVDEAMRDYDKLRSGFITAMQFQSALGKLKFQKFVLSQTALEQLCERYTANDPQGYPKIAWNRFADEMEEVFTVKGMEKDPKKAMKVDVGQFQNKFVCNKLPDDEEARAEQIMARIRGVVRSRRILLKPVFQDYDRAAKGVYQTRFTSRKRFHRVLAVNNIHLSEEEVELLEEKYEAKDAGNATDNINYVLFCDDLEPAEKPLTAASSVAAAVPTKAFVKPGRRGILELQEVIEDIQTQVLTNRVRLAEFFRDFDQLRSGDISRAHFASGLSMARVELDDAEVNLLAEAFPSKKRPGAVRWQDFCDDIDEVHTSKRLESNPAKTSTKQKDIIAKRKAEQEPVKDEEIYKVLDTLREMVRAKGILLPPFFNDFDKHNTGRITVPQLSQVMSRHNFPLSEQQVALIVKCYGDVRTRDVNYRRLVRDIDASEDPVVRTKIASDENRRRDETLRRSAGTGTGRCAGFGFTTEAPPDATCDDLVESIRSRVVKDSVRIKDFFRDADKLHKGYVPVSKFRSGLSLAGFRLGHKELEMLEASFPAAALDGAVDYPRFCDLVTPEAADRGLERSPTKARATYKPSKANPLKANRVGEDETRKAHTDAAVDKLKRDVATRRALPRPAFLDFDKIRRGRVTPSQFAAVLDKLSLKLPEEQMKAVTDRFIDDRGDVDYMSFCAAVDPAR